MNMGSGGGGFHFSLGVFPFCFFNLNGETIAYVLNSIETFVRPYLQNLPTPQLNIPPDRRTEADKNKHL